MNPIWWLIAILFYCGQAWVSQKQNTNLDMRWFWIACVYSALPVWPMIARLSKNLLLDGMIYDVVLFVSYAGTLLLMGAGKSFALNQWVGFALVLAGFFLMKVKI
jgi:hypothetical protein